MNKRILYLCVLIGACYVAVSVARVSAQGGAGLIAGRNINMVSGTTIPGGDPYWQKQNEPSIAVSARRPMTLLAGSNDSRTVDLPGLPEDMVTGDSWLAYYESYDGGLSWKSTLLPGFPQDTSAEGMASPLKGFTAAADPTMRAGTNGMFYLNGIVFNRGANALGLVFVSRFIDLNNREGVSFAAGKGSVKRLGTVAIDTGTAGQFTDKPWLAIDIPREGAAYSNLTVPDEDAPGGQVYQNFPCGNGYLAYAIFTGETKKNVRSKIMFSRTTDCAASWSKPAMINESYRISQGTAIAVAPNTGHLYLTWRQFRAESEPDAIVIAKSTDFGRKFTKAMEVAAIGNPMDQPTLPSPSIPGFRAFRSNAYPTIAIDGSERVYLAWSERGHGPNGEARIVLTTSPDGVTWSVPAAVDNHLGPGHQIMPSLTFASGKLTLLYYDFRDDIYPNTAYPVADPIAWEPAWAGGPIRHSVDVWATEADPGASPVFAPATKVSRYMTTIIPDQGSQAVQESEPGGELPWKFLQLQVSAPNYPLYAGGQSPFIGDYVDIAAAPPFVFEGGSWRFSTQPGDPKIRHATWTDNRDVAPPPSPPEPGYPDWINYTPPSQSPGPCGSNAGMRNQNVYTARISRGLVAGTLGNSKYLDPVVEKSFALLVHNETFENRSYSLQILNQPPGAAPGDPWARFANSSIPNSINVADVPPYSGFVRSMLVKSTDPRAAVRIRVTDDRGVWEDIVLNPDPTNPPLVKTLQPDEEIFTPFIENRSVFTWPLLLGGTEEEPELNPNLYRDTDLLNPALLNPALLNPALLNPALLNPALLNPALLNPALLNPALLNPALLNPALLNPALLNPALLNPALLNPALLNPALLNQPLTDITWQVTNGGNTAAGYSFAPVAAAGLPANATQMLVYRAYKTPFNNNCQLTEEGVQYEILANILDPEVLDPENPALLNPALLNAVPGVTTFRMAPEEEIFITLRVVGDGGGTFNPNSVATAIVSQWPNTDGSLPKADQAITFNPLPDRAYGDPPFTLGATSSSGLPITFSASGSCTVSGNTVTLTGAGSCTITALQGGSVNYYAADPVEQAFSIAKAGQVITFEPLGDRTWGDPPFAVGASASSGLPVSFSASGNCTVSGAIVTITGAGTCTITASQAGNANYSAAPDVSWPFTIARADQVITFEHPGNRTIGEVFTVSATASSGLTVSFSASGSCTVSGNTVTIISAGDCTITASQPGDEYYSAALDVSHTIAVGYVFVGFLPPLGPEGTDVVYGPFNLKSATPLKWQLLDSAGSYFRDLSAVVLLQAVRGCPGEAPGTPFELYPLTTGNSELRYSPTNEQFVFNWDTASLEPGCYKVLLTLDDGTVRTIIIQLN